MVAVTRLLKHTDILVGLGLLAIVGMLMLPMPHWLLDTGLVAAMTVSVVIVLMAVNINDPLQFSVFPSLLLVTTIFRLALSVAATKLILGTGDAGHVIQTFGDFVMGGDPVVGFVAFLILVIVQFMVITKGSERVSEVVARFTLDAIPGNQMAIDADLNAGLIDENQARERRKRVRREADFYGAMDGASKFVKGDAIAAIMIIAVNIVAGFIIGYMKGGGDFMTILKQYTMLSVGEGLVAQMPALLISTASGLMVTRAGQERSMGGEVASQVFGQPKALQIASVALAAMAIVPGFPAMIFLAASGLCFGAFRMLSKNPEILKSFDEGKKKDEAAAPAAIEPPKPTGPEEALAMLAVDAIEIEVGFGLIGLADARAGGDLTERIAATRRQVAIELGYVIPKVRICDSTRLESDEYTIKIRGEEVTRARCVPGGLLAVDSGAVIYPVAGTPTKDPVFNLEALWIDASQKLAAEGAGYTVIEPSAVISTHLAELVKQYSAELLTRQDVQKLVDKAKEENEAVVSELVPQVLSIGDVQKVLQHLLRERVPIRDMATILETMADFAKRVKDPEQLGELVRSAIARTITRQHVDPENRLFCITLEPALERELSEAVTVSSFGSSLILPPDKQNSIVERLQDSVDDALSKGYQAVVICSSGLRLPLRRLLERSLPKVSVLAYSEIAARADVEFVGQVRAA
ncbi:flagellar biosynthesis protein FlhA [bacterium]|nr:MAG: flagellar biosynthesis protein FlhA [bacterium]